MPFYAVAKGVTPGIYSSWSEAESQIKGFSGPKFKKFNSMSEAEEFLKDNNVEISKKKKPADSDSSNASSGSESDNDAGGKRKHSDDDEDDDEDESDGAPSPKKAATADKEGFTVDAEGSLVVYTHGTMNGTKGGAGVYFGTGNPLNVSELVRGKASKNSAEIQAAQHALELAKKAGYDKVVINTDCQFVIDCASKWTKGWKKNDWKKKDGTEIANKDDLVALDAASDNMNLKWNHVKGKTGITGVDEANQLARAGAKK